VTVEPGPRGASQSLATSGTVGIVDSGTDPRSPGREPVVQADPRSSIAERVIAVVVALGLILATVAVWLAARSLLTESAHPTGPGAFRGGDLRPVLNRQRVGNALGTFN